MLFGSDRSHYFAFLPHKKANISLSEPLSSFCIVPGEYPNTTDGVLYLIRVIGGLYHPLVRFLPHNWQKKSEISTV
jgi:hypothetical protein